MHPINFELILVNTYLLNERTRHLEFKLSHDAPLKFQPGQFISLHIKKDLEIVRRNFSIANIPNNSSTIEIAATFIPNGIASTTLWNMKLGDQLKASGPFGIFILRSEDLNRTKRYILVATGTGVTPYRAMLHNLRSILENTDQTIILLLGVRNASELLYGNEFIDFAATYPNFKFMACYSRQNSTEILHNYEHEGYVQHKLKTLNINPAEDLVYLCGNPNMVDESLTILETLGLSKNKIRREKYISSK